jgi:3-oxoacyl-[acyl-carrier-protein] synthase II
MKLKRVVVTGIGAVTPIGNNANLFWDNLLKGKSGAAPITRFDASKFKTQFACEVKGLDLDDHFDRKEGRKLDLFSKFALIVAGEAVSDARLIEDSVNQDRVGVIFGSGIGGIGTFQDEVKGFFQGDGTPRFNPFFIPKMISDIAAGHISMKYGFRGPNFSLVSACATSTNALIDSYNYIRLGKADVIVSGGSEAAINESGIGGFNAMHALSTRNDDPQTASRPFDKDRDGFVMGEGAGAIILEEYEHAKARGAKIYAEICGGGMSADAHHITAPHPDGLGALNVMHSALEDDPDLTPESLDYVNVHGTSTPLGDIAELKAIKAVFGDHAYKMNVSSTKSMTGHLLGAAGAIESIATLLAVKDDIVPPTINHFTDDDGIDQKLNLTFGEPQRRTINVALSNTFGFGGHNASVIFKKFVG